MNTKRVFEIMKNKEIRDIYYEERPVWIQEVKDNIAKVGFMDNYEEKNVYIEDLYESNLYNP
ncbi:MAG: H-type small acid-soluble spore protein [Clostridia bacterium]